MRPRIFIIRNLARNSSGSEEVITDTWRLIPFLSAHFLKCDFFCFNFALKIKNTESINETEQSELLKLVLEISSGKNQFLKKIDFKDKKEFKSLDLDLERDDIHNQVIEYSNKNNVTYNQALNILINKSERSE